MELKGVNTLALNVSRPFRMFAHKYSRNQYYEARVLAREHASRASDECVIYEGYDNTSEGDWEFDDNEILNRRTYNNEGAAMFCVFDYETKELVRNSDDDVMFYKSVKFAYDDQEDVINSEDEFNGKFLIFEVPEIRKGEVNTDASIKPKTFAGDLRKTATEGGWHTNK